MKEKRYIISESELLDLISDSNKLEALECGGVDNWIWYGGAIGEFIKNKIEEDGYGQMLLDRGKENLEDIEIKDFSYLDLKYYEPFNEWEV